jgi:MFS family permease
MRRYSRLFATPRAGWLFVGAFLGRVPHAMESIGTVVLVKETMGSYGVAGVVAAGLASGIAIGSVAQGRRADRRGRRALLPLAVVHLSLMVTLVLGAAAGWGPAVLAAVGFGVGYSVPPTSSVFRALYPKVFGSSPADLRLAFAFDSAFTDVTYVAGPALVSLGVLLSGPAMALLFSAGAALASVLVLLWRGPEAATTGSSARMRGSGALRASGVRAVTLATFPLGVAYGMTTVAYPAFGSSRGQLALGGLLLSFNAIASSLSALFYGAHRSRTGPTAIFIRYSLAFPPTFLAPALGSSPLAVAALSIPGGLVTGQWLVSRNHLTGLLAAPGSAVEAYSWPVTSLLAGTALGTALAGPLVDHGSWRLALLVASLIAVGIGVCAVAQRKSLAVGTHVQGTVSKH